MRQRCWRMCMLRGEVEQATPGNMYFPHTLAYKRAFKGGRSAGTKIWNRLLLALAVSIVLTSVSQFHITPPTKQPRLPRKRGILARELDACSASGYRRHFRGTESGGNNLVPLQYHTQFVLYATKGLAKRQTWEY